MLSPNPRNPPQNSAESKLRCQTPAHSASRLALAGCQSVRVPTNCLLEQATETVSHPRVSPFFIFHSSTMVSFGVLSAAPACSTRPSGPSLQGVCVPVCVTVCVPACVSPLGCQAVRLSDSGAQSKCPAAHQQPAGLQVPLGRQKEIGMNWQTPLRDAFGNFGLLSLLLPPVGLITPSFGPF